MIAPIVEVDVTILRVSGIVPVGWLEHREVELDEDLEGRIAVELAYSVRFLFKDVEVVFEAGVDVVPLVDEGTSSSVLVVWGGGERGGTSNVFVDVLEVRDFVVKASGGALGVFDSEDKEGDIDLWRSCCG